MSCKNESCTCPNVDCERHGKCCQCVNHHREKDIPVYCMKDKVCNCN